MWIARPSTARAASFSASLNVGWAWEVRAMSSAEAPNSSASAASAIIVPASGPMMWTPSTRSFAASASTLTKPSVSALARARVGGERELADPVLRPGRFQLVFGLADRGDLGPGVDHRWDRPVVDFRLLSGQPFGDCDAL